MAHNLFRYEATVATGFEGVLKKEIINKLGGTSVQIEKGRVFFDAPFDRCVEVFSLKGADNLSVVLVKSSEISFSNEKEADLQQLRQLPNDIDWNHGLNVWAKATDQENPIIQKLAAFNQEKTPFFNTSKADLSNILSVTSNTTMNSDNDSSAKDFRFRVTCNRNGENHSFSSQEAAAAFGGTIKDTYNWGVNLKNYDLEIILYINNSSYYVCIGLTRLSLHYRNLTICGKLTLRPSVAYNLLGLASIQPGDIICDPMAGFGSIPIEAAMEFSQNYVLCGDINSLAVHQCVKNTFSLNQKLEANGRKKLNLSAFQWDAFSLPLRNNSVDVFVTDLPFGKTCGRKSALPNMYLNVVKEMARTCRTSTGRCVLLVLNQKILTQAVSQFKQFLLLRKVVPVNLGNLKTKVCVYKRTEEKF